MSQTINSSGIYPHTGPGAGDLRINKAGFQTPNITNGTVPGGSVPILSVTADGLEKQHQTSQPPALLRLRPVTTPPIGGAAKLSQVRILNCQSKEMLKYLRCPLCQRSPTFWHQGLVLWEINVPQTQGRWFGMIQAHLLCPLSLLLLRQLHLSSPGIRSWRLGTLALCKQDLN